MDWRGPFFRSQWVSDRRYPAGEQGFAEVLQDVLRPAHLPNFSAVFWLGAAFHGRAADPVLCAPSTSVHLAVRQDPSSLVLPDLHTKPGDGTTRQFWFELASGDVVSGCRG